MIRSMTGYGRAEVVGERIVVSVEARSLNHRHLDVALKLPRSLAGLELEARRLLQGQLQRGRLDVSVSVKWLPPARGARGRGARQRSHGAVRHPRGGSRADDPAGSGGAGSASGAGERTDQGPPG